MSDSVVSYNKSSQIDIRTLTISKPGNISESFDISSLLEEFIIYEDIYQTAISAKLIFRDQVNLVGSLPIVSGETVTIKYKTPIYSDYVTLDFIVYNIGEREIPNSSENIQVNQLFLCTPEVWWAANNDISAGYIGTYSEIIDKLLKETETKKSFTKEDSIGITTFVCPMWNTFKAIKWCSGRTNTKSLSPVFFWESSKGYNLKSLKSMYDTSVYKRLYIEERGTSGAETDSDRVFNSVYSYEYTESNNRLKQYSDGVFGSETYELDFNNKRISKIQRSYIDNTFKRQDIHIEGFSLNDDASKIRKKFDFNMQRNDDSNLSNFTKLSSMGLIDNVRILISIPGDSNLTVGNTIWLEIPSKSGFDIGKEELISGKWLVRSIKNLIQKTTFSQVVELTKDSFAVEVRKA